MSEFNLPRRRFAVAPYATTEPIFRDVGVIDSVELNFPIEGESYYATDVSGDACLEYVAYRTKNVAEGTCVINMMSSEAKNLAMALMGGDLTESAGGTEPEHTFPTGVAVDSILALPYIPDPATIVITDSDVGPATLVEGTHWEWYSKAAGRIRILALDSFVEPLLANGDSVASKAFSPMSSLNDFWMLDFSGANEANACSAASERIYRAQIGEEAVRQLHLAGETRLPQPIAVTFDVERDESRSYEFGNFLSV